MFFGGVGILSATIVLSNCLRRRVRRVCGVCGRPKRPRNSCHVSDVSRYSATTPFLGVNAERIQLDNLAYWYMTCVFEYALLGDASDRAEIGSRGLRAA